MELIFKYVDNNLTAMDVIERVKYVVNKSYDEDGVYRSYLKDYVSTIIALKAFTDYDGDESVNTILEICYSSYYQDFIESNVFDTKNFIKMYFDYIRDEIYEINKPMAKLNKVFNSLIRVLDTGNELIKKIDPEMLNGLNIKEFIENIK